MRVGLITDQHFGIRSDAISFLDYQEKFYKEVFFPKLDEQQINTLLILGDTFDRRKYVNFVTLKRTKEMFFDELLKRNIQVHVLAGNHDTAHKNTNEVNSVDLVLREYSNVHVIDSPMTITVDGHEICMVPWICADNWKQCIDEMQNTKSTICMGHFEIAGFAMHRGMVSEEGLEMSLFKRFDMTFSGHYHHRSNSNNIYYLGSPMEFNWNDYNDQRGFHLFDLQSRELEFIPNPNIMFHRIIYDDKTESITDIQNKDLTKYTSSYVKVVVVNKTNPYLFDQFMNKLYQSNPLDITIVEDVIDLTEGVDDDIIDEAEDTITIINKFVDALSSDGIDNERLKTILREIYVEAINLTDT